MSSRGARARLPLNVTGISFIALLTSLLPPFPVFGEIRAYQGQVRSTVRGLAMAPDDSFILDEDAYDRTITPFEIDAHADLAAAGVDGLPLARGRAVAVLSDPRTSTTGNPGEFALEAGTFSNDERITYLLNASAVERRDTRFTALDFALGGIPGRLPSEVISTVHLSGAIVFWSTTSAFDLTGAQAEWTVTVRDSRTSAPVLRLRRIFVGRADGTVLSIEAETLGVLGRVPFTRILDLEALRASRAPEAQALVEQADRLGLTTFVVVLMPLQTVDYVYAVDLNRDFMLEAEFMLAAQSAPTGTGVAGVMGRPFAGLNDLFEDSVAGADGRIIQTSVNKMIDTLGEVPDDAGAPAPAAMGCGLLGFDVFAFGAMLPWLHPRCLPRRSRAGRPPRNV